MATVAAVAAAVAVVGAAALVIRDGGLGQGRKTAVVGVVVEVVVGVVVAVVMVVAAAMVVRARGRSGSALGEKCRTRRQVGSAPCAVWWCVIVPIEDYVVFCEPFREMGRG